MKKLMMFAAAMTIVGGAYAQCSDPDVIDTDCLLTYNVKMNLRTVTGKAVKGTISQDLCSDGVAVAGCVRIPKVGLGLQGYLFVCDCGCEALGDSDDTLLFLGNSKLKTTLFTDEFEFDWMHILGNGKSSETSWTLTTDGDYRDVIGPMSLWGTGFGTVGVKQGVTVFTGFSGGVVGFLAEPRCLAAGANNCEIAGYWLCDGELEFDDPSVIYGTWAMKLNPKLSGIKAGSNFSAVLRKAFPGWAYAQFAEEDRFDF